ncbi:leucine--tRNA ligase [archaeon]|nr:leucine--tRNA ligase [archaeon]|tara:strand:+ start:1793 stop:4678 length:2886 start_codon:yes stop_codon:yes gene_type:complete
MTIQWQEIQEKWQNKWQAANLGIAKPKENKEKFFMIFAYPGISGFLHVGHMRGFSYTDAICRLERMKGKEVLFPVGTHASGNHAFAFARKVKDQNEDWINYLKKNGCSNEQLKKLEDPNEIINYFNDVYVNQYWKKFGFLCDWDRFTSTTNDDYNKFIQWQFRKLNEKGMLIQKPYYAPYSENCGPVAVDPSETDLSRGGNAEKQEYTLLKFKLGNSDEYLVAATLRPETIYGQTNLWINTLEKYVKVQVPVKDRKETWIMSSVAAEKLSYQKDDTKELSSIDPLALLGKVAIAPGIERKIPILPASFVAASVGSGIVTSVPSDAPFDYVALQELRNNEGLRGQMQRWGINLSIIDNIELIPIIKTEGYKLFPGKEAAEKHQVKSLKDKDNLEAATKDVYKAGFHSGVMRENCGPYANMPVARAKEQMKADLLSEDKADIFYDLSEEVICRFGGRVFIKRIDDQWFIDYGHKEVTDQTKQHAETMSIYPGEYQDNLPAILDWFGPRSCARLGSWMGTKLPFDDKWTIEPISDSTLYPVYYIVAGFIKRKEITTEELTEEFFDYIYLGKEPQNNESKKPIWDTIKNEFDYFYPLNINLGGKEHKTVHFPVFLMNHVAILPKDKWPKGIFVNWWVTSKGSDKISKSKGGAVPIPDAIEKYGVDAMRLYYAHIGSPHVDVAWDETVVHNYKGQLEKIAKLTEELAAVQTTSTQPIDAWLESEFHQTLESINKALKIYNLRELATLAYYKIPDIFKWYLRRGGANHNLTSWLLDQWMRLLVPLTPHLAEELAHNYTNLAEDEFVSTSTWPKHNSERISQAALASEESIKTTIEGMRSVLKLAKIEQPKRYQLFTARSWLYTLFKVVKDKMQETRNVGHIIPAALEFDELKPHAKEVSKLIVSLCKDPSKLPSAVTSSEEEYNALTAAKSFLEQETSAIVEIIKAENSEHPKANAAMPGRAGIVVE